MRRYLILSLLALVGLLPTNAQYTFTIHVSWSGNCSGYTAQMNQAIRGFQAQAINGFPTRELCEQTRALCHQELGHIEVVYYDARTGKEIKREATNCKLNITTAPCSGRPLAGTVGTLNALGVSQGTSFYSANSANEIPNWSSDNVERKLAFDKHFDTFKPANVSTGDMNFDNARKGIDPNTKFISVNMRDEQGHAAQSNEYYFGEVLSPNDDRWANILEKESAKELDTEYTISENEDYSEIDLYADVAEDLLHNLLDLIEATGVAVGTTTILGTIGTAVLADLAISLIVEDGVAAYKWIANDEIVSTSEIFKNTLDRASFGLTGATKAGLEEALVREGMLSRNHKIFSKAGSIAIRTIHYGDKLYDKLKEGE